VHTLVSVADELAAGIGENDAAKNRVSVPFPFSEVLRNPHVC